MSVSAEQQRLPPLESRTIPFNIDGKTVDVECIVTEHGDTLVSVNDYVTPFTGCAPKDASNKFAFMYNGIPLLRPPEHELRHYSKVSIYTFNSSTLYSDTLFL